MKSSYNSQTSKTAGAVVISSVVLIGIYTLILNHSSQSKTSAATTTTTSASESAVSAITPTATPTSGTVVPTTTVSTTPSPTATAKPSSTAVASGYKDGTYKATDPYYVPRSETNSISITVTVKSGLISAVQVSDDYSDHESGRYVSSFESGISSAVVGQKIDQVNVYRLGGASLTSDAFNAALSQIMSTAKA